jgi:peptide/nickel transport system permease protein
MTMLTYLIKRISTLILSLWIISICLFYLQKNVAGDIVMLQSKGRSNGPFYVHPLAAEKVYSVEAIRLNLHKPLFYFSLKSALFPDTFYRIQYPEAIKIKKDLLLQTGNWPLVQSYFQALTKFYEIVVKSENSSLSIFWRERLEEIALSSDLAAIKSKLRVSKEMNEPFEVEIKEMNEILFQLSKCSPSFLSWFPRLHIYGLDNQYHKWFVKIISGDFGTSSRDGRLVKDKIQEAIPWTLWVNGLAIGIAYLFSFPMGIFMALIPKSAWTKWVNHFLLALYALPSFWIASLLLFQATSPGAGFPFFSISGWTFYQQNGGFINQPISFLLQLSLPVFCMTYGLAAYLTGYMQSSFLKVLKEPYIMYARTKGISGFRLYVRHVLPNALLPQIVFIAGVIPALVTGSVVIEVIFNIPGMGRLLIDSMLSQDWATVYSFVLLVSCLTALGLILSDILLVLSDPRIRFSATKNEAS